MSLYAVDAIDDALEATRAFLWPFDRGRWGRLALVVLFLGGAGGANPIQFTSGTSGPGNVGTEVPTPDAGLPAVGGTELAVIVGVVALLVLVGLAFVLVGSVMEFVLVESLRREAVTVRRYWRERWRQGLRLFGFRVLLGVVTLGTAGLLVAATLGPALAGDAGFSLGLFALLLPLLAVIAVASGLVGGFTTAFVVPVMIAEDRTLLAAWRRFWPTLTGGWKQYAAYAVLAWVLRLVLGIVTSLATLLAAVILAIPFGLVGLLGAGLLTVVEPAGWVVIGVVVLLFVLAMVAISLLVAVPVQTYLRYYALFVLGDTNGAFDLVAERRRAVREEG